MFPFEMFPVQMGAEGKLRSHRASFGCLPAVWIPHKASVVAVPPHQLSQAPKVQLSPRGVPTPPITTSPYTSPYASPYMKGNASRRLGSKEVIPELPAAPLVLEEVVLLSRSSSPLPACPELPAVREDEAVEPTEAEQPSSPSSPARRKSSLDVDLRCLATQAILATQAVRSPLNRVRSDSATLRAKLQQGFYSVWSNPEGAEALDIRWSSLEDKGLEILREIGQGSQSTVHLAQCRNGELRCVKNIAKQGMLGKGTENLVLEFKVMQKLGNHPRIASVFDLFQVDDTYHLVQQYFSGGDFCELKRSAEQASVALTEVWWGKVFKQCFEGLAHLHDNAVMHCDLKEPNLMIQTKNFKEPSVVLIDFGVAQPQAAECSVIYGTPGYIPPEVWGSKVWRPESDSFSLGVVMFQMLTDRTPLVNGSRCGIFIEGARGFAQIASATKTREPPFDEMPREAPQLKRLVQRLLEKSPLQRPSPAMVLQDEWLANFSESANDVHESMMSEKASLPTQPQSHLQSLPTTIGSLSLEPSPETTAAFC